MTWIVGVGTLGIVAIFGDTAVTYENGTVATEYGVQKVDGLSELTAVGFAGSVGIGFEQVFALGRIASEIGRRAEVPEILKAWYEPAVTNYRNQYSPDLRAHGCDLILIGASDQPLLDNDGRSVAGLHRSHGYVIRMPRGDEKPQLPEPMKIGSVSIGSGSVEPEYVRAVGANALKVLMDVQNWRQSVTFAAHHILGIILRDTVERNPVSGVAETLVGAVIRHDGFYADAVSYKASDLASVKHPVPPLAKSMAELLDFEKRFGVPTAAGIAIS